jgi:hypothetical protein
VARQAHVVANGGKDQTRVFFWGWGNEEEVQNNGLRASELPQDVEGIRRINERRQNWQGAHLHCQRARESAARHVSGPHL